jgi:hypothetical protein
MNKRVLRKWLKAGVVDRGQLHRTEMGTPQGGIISPTLANITLNGLERGLKQFLQRELGSRASARAKVNLVRYADDFVVTGDSKELLEALVKPWIAEFLRERGLQFSEEKTKIVHIDEGFDFLGWNFRKYGGKMLIKPSRKNVKALYGKVRDVIDSSLSVPTGVLINRLNPVLRGWAEYHKGVVAKATFSRLDHLIRWRLLRWGLRRHPRKTVQWVHNHYWLQLGTRRAMAATKADAQGDATTLVLYQLSDMKIVRHQKVNGDYNPFDPNWVLYGEQLQVTRMSQDLWDAQRLKLWMQQGGRTPAQADVARALAEDVGAGDLTAGLIDPTAQARARVLAAKAPWSAARPGCRRPSWRWTRRRQITWYVQDGGRCEANQVVFEVQGRAQALLTPSAPHSTSCSCSAPWPPRPPPMWTRWPAPTRRSWTRARPCRACAWRRNTRCAAAAAPTTAWACMTRC